MKDPASTSPLLHFFSWSLATPAIIGLTTWNVIGALGGDSVEQARFTVVTVPLAIPLGCFLGVVSFLVVRGARGWSAYFTEKRQQQQAMDAAMAAAYASTDAQDAGAPREVPAAPLPAAPAPTEPPAPRPITHSDAVVLLDDDQDEYLDAAKWDTYR